LVYDLLMGGIVTLAYSVYHFDVLRIEEHNDKGDQPQQQQRRTTGTQKETVAGIGESSIFFSKVI
jgi:hypothetical protein